MRPIYKLSKIARRRKDGDGVTSGTKNTNNGVAALMIRKIGCKRGY